MPWSLSVALAAGREAETAHASGSARDIATMAALVVVAISFHFLLALPDGRLHDSVRRVMASAGYLVVVAVGLVFVVDQRSFSLVDGAVSWTIAGVLAIAPLRSRYIGSIGYHRERMEWFGIGVTLAATVALVATVLHLLVGWPGQLGAVTAAATVLVPLGLLAGENKKMGPHASRGLVQALAVFGFSLVIAAIYLVVVLGLGHAPKTIGRQRGPGPLHGRLRSGGSDLRPRTRPLSRFRHPVRLWVT